MEAFAEGRSAESAGAAGAPGASDESAIFVLVGTFQPFTRSRLLYLSNLDRMACDQGHGTYPELNYGSGTKWIKNLTRDRLGNFNGGRYSEHNLASVLYTQRLDKPEYVKLKV